MAKSRQCANCGAEILSVLYFGADNLPVGGHQVCANCGPRSVVDVDVKAPDLRRKLLERKAS
jgi:DNA-directed RNA polymerase subunit RPC12/RpoP